VEETVKRITRTIAAATAALGLLATIQAGAANAVTNTPSKGSYVAGPGCDGGSHFGWSGGPDWLYPNPVGDYTGSLVYGFPETGTCANQTYYAYTTQGPANYQFYWFYGVANGDLSVAGLTCYVWAYIPSMYAVAYDALYRVHGADSNGNIGSLLFTHTVNQNPISGWVYLGEHAMGGYDTVAVELNNQDASHPGRQIGVGAMAFECS
jgi:hypothetical protein